MTHHHKDPRQSMRKISDLFIEDLLLTSDSDILSENPSKDAGEKAKVAYAQALKLAGKNRIQAARNAIDGEKVQSQVLAKGMDIGKARQILEKLAANDSEFQKKVTLAARNLRDISDAEVLSIILDLQRLGALPDD
jgi:t-SNARE complex subunit (syntaxin)